MSREFTPTTLIGMTDHPNAPVVREGFEAFQRGDMEKIRSLMADDMEWTVLGNNPTSGVYKGKSAIIGYFGKLIMETEGTLDIEYIDFIGNDEKVVAMTHVKAERNGKTLDVNAIQIFGMNAIHKAVSCIGPYSDNSAQINEFWSD